MIPARQDSIPDPSLPPSLNLCSTADTTSRPFSSSATSTSHAKQADKPTIPLLLRHSQLRIPLRIRLRTLPTHPLIHAHLPVYLRHTLPAYLANPRLTLPYLTSYNKPTNIRECTQVDSKDQARTLGNAVCYPALPSSAPLHTSFVFQLRLRPQSEVKHELAIKL